MANPISIAIISSRNSSMGGWVVSTRPRCQAIRILDEWPSGLGGGKFRKSGQEEEDHLRIDSWTAGKVGPCFSHWFFSVSGFELREGLVN